MALRTGPENTPEGIKLKQTSQLSPNSLESTEVSTDRRNEVTNLNQKYGKKGFSFSIYSEDAYHIAVKHDGKNAFLMEPFIRTTGKSYSISDGEQVTYITSVRDQNLSKYLDQFEKTGNPKIDPLSDIYTKINIIGQVGQEKFNELIKELGNLTPEEKVKIWTRISIGLLGGKMTIVGAKTLTPEMLKALFVTLNPFAIGAKLGKMSGKIDM